MSIALIVLILMVSTIVMVQGWALFKQREKLLMQNIEIDGLRQAKLFLEDKVQTFRTKIEVLENVLQKYKKQSYEQPIPKAKLIEKDAIPELPASGRFVDL